MKNIDPVDFIRERLPQGELLAQLAEECAELSKAALKLRRVYDGTNPTPVKRSEAYDNLLEEVADVTLCLNVLGITCSMPEVQRTANEKLSRWCKRLTARKCPVCNKTISASFTECPYCRVTQFDPDDFMGEYEDENE